MKPKITLLWRFHLAAIERLDIGRFSKISMSVSPFSDNEDLLGR